MQAQVEALYKYPIEYDLYGTGSSIKGGGFLGLFVMVP
jgi:hypothetical protein